MTSPKIQVATQSDFPAIKEIADRHCQSGSIFFRPLLPVDPRGIEETDSQIYLIANVEERSVGYLSLHSDRSFQSNEHYAEVEVVVDPDRRRNGIGLILLKKAVAFISTSTKVKEMHAKIKRGNSASEKMCMKTGFVMRHQEDMGSTWVLRIER